MNALASAGIASSKVFLLSGNFKSLFLLVKKLKVLKL